MYASKRKRGRERKDIFGKSDGHLEKQGKHLISLKSRNHFSPMSNN